MTNKEMLEKNEWHIDKMRRKGNTKFRTFIISTLLLLIAWCVSMAPWYQDMLVHYMRTTPDEALMYMMGLFGIWKTLNIVFFLAPALGDWWEMKACKRKMEAK